MIPFYTKNESKFIPLRTKQMKKKLFQIPKKEYFENKSYSILDKIIWTKLDQAGYTA